MAQINQPLVALPQFQGKRPEKMALWVCNDLAEAFPKAALRWTVRADGKVLVEGRTRLDVPALNAVQGPVVDLTPATRDRRVCEVELILENAEGTGLSTYRRTLRGMPKDGTAKAAGDSGNAGIVTPPRDPGGPTTVPPEI